MIQLDGRRIHVVGASGIEGADLLLYLVGHLGLSDVVAHDFSPDSEAFQASFLRANTAGDREGQEGRLAQLLSLPVELRLGPRYLEGVDKADLIFASQNWFNYPPNLPALPEAQAHGAQLVGILDLAVQLFPGTCIGVTGSNGKSTTCALIRHVLEAAAPEGVPVLSAGNDRGRQVALADLATADPRAVAIWEVSNRHLRDRPVACNVATLTNLSANHIGDHGSWEDYVAAKVRLVTAPGPGGHAILCGSDVHSEQLLEQVRATGATLWQFDCPPQPGQRGGFSWADGETIWLQYPDGRRVQVRDASGPRLWGDHNRRNLMAALATAAAADFGPLDGDLALENFQGLPERLEAVANKDGVVWIDDIQATTAPAAAAGIEAVARQRNGIVLLVGGEDKAMDYRGMADAAAVHVQHVLCLPGSGTDAFLAALADRVPVERPANLDSMLVRARGLAAPGGAVLLSPGCAFFRRDHVGSGPPFQVRVRQLLGTGGGGHS